MRPIHLYKTLLILTCFLPFWSHAQEAFEPNRSVSLEDFKQKALESKEEIWVVDFWASWCRPCIMSIPELKGVYNEFEGQPVRFFSISWDDNVDMWSMAMERMEMPWPQLRVDPKEGDEFITKTFPHNAIPSIFMILPEGKVKKISNPEKLEKTLTKQLKKMG